MSLPPLIDAHIHLDSYSAEEQEALLFTLAGSGVEAVISVSMNLRSCEANLRLSSEQPGTIFPAFGYHPEQPLPGAAELEQLFRWMEHHADRMIAVGEVGLPYYSAQEAALKGAPFDRDGYIELLERFILFAKRYDKPIVLHAVYEDADIACRLLERHHVTRAHFHWFKGSPATIERMAQNGYYISFTPDLLYEPDIRALAEIYPLSQVMAETDGPWPFEGRFAEQTTHPRMTSDVIQAYCSIHGMTGTEGRQLFRDNTRRFYKL
ncbi:TatD family hydrolase [Paenibacillus sp. P96]|uniref:TatD family hydrolase n=1 Tax=Paenibacillus zeirhizosphaerae TaxID=2987519 RepID=A0ABT9FNQ2_9BACL|nr:TatD family hydrolase [Paenibacillus sp. P96]MDP4096027.1 TatD family hydrolase [Paenibacillus sp. P96]